MDIKNYKINMLVTVQESLPDTKEETEPEPSIVEFTISATSKKSALAKLGRLLRDLVARGFVAQDDYRLANINENAVAPSLPKYPQSDYRKDTGAPGHPPGNYITTGGNNWYNNFLNEMAKLKRNKK